MELLATRSWLAIVGSETNFREPRMSSYLRRQPVHGPNLAGVMTLRGSDDPGSGELRHPAPSIVVGACSIDTNRHLAEHQFNYFVEKFVALDGGPVEYVTDGDVRL